MNVGELLEEKHALRVKNLLQWCAEHYEEQKDLAEAIGWTPSYLSQLKTRRRNISEKLARDVIEPKLRMPSGYLDQDPDSRPSTKEVDLVEAVMLAVDRAKRELGITLTEEKNRLVVTHVFRQATRLGQNAVNLADVKALVRLAG